MENNVYASWNSLVASAERAQEDNNPAEAEDLLKRSKVAAEAAFGTEHANYALCCVHLGQFFELSERYPEAEKEYRNAVQVIEQMGSTPTDRALLSMTLANLAKVVHRQNRSEEADELRARASKLLMQHLAERFST